MKLRWREVDGDTLELEDSKTGPRQVLLSPEAHAIIKRQPREESPWVFPSPVNPARARFDLSLWKKVRKLAGIEDVRLHDLRHDVRQPSSDARYSAAGGGTSARPRPSANDAALRARQRP